VVDDDEEAQGYHVVYDPRDRREPQLYPSHHNHDTHPIAIYDNGARAPWRVSGDPYELYD
jgi:hypothetical protein